jgi:hypothetical protein
MTNKEIYAVIKILLSNNIDLIQIQQYYEKLFTLRSGNMRGQGKRRKVRR